jgi:hypothetical protein
MGFDGRANYLVVGSCLSLNAGEAYRNSFAMTVSRSVAGEQRDLGHHGRTRDFHYRMEIAYEGPTTRLAVVSRRLHRVCREHLHGRFGPRKSMTSRGLSDHLRNCQS